MLQAGFSPNELVFGHTVQGPLAVLGADLNPGEPPEVKSPQWQCPYDLILNVYFLQ